MHACMYVCMYVCLLIVSKLTKRTIYTKLFHIEREKERNIMRTETNILAMQLNAM